MLTDCSSIQGSTTSSSSDVMTLTTASSWCAIPPNSRIRLLRLTRPHARRLLTPDSNPTFGFSIRGGKEFSTGFFISNVERNSEADLKGMRVGDQILRINGFRVDDAVHKEFVQFVSSQDRITLKVRDVGMLPIKDKENERLSWNVVKNANSVSNTPSESSSMYKSIASTIDRDVARSKDVNIVLDVAPRTKLGLGICKGPEWKPGIYVQFTKEKSVARDAGLKPGDQILSVNSIDFSDVLFSEAVAVMKGSNKLDMTIRTAAGCDLFPGESSGYNSSASSVTGDQSPCWADAKSKRLTAVREEPFAACWNESVYNTTDDTNRYRQSVNKDSAPTTTVSKELNKTIIKLSENGATSINNTYIAPMQLQDNDAQIESKREKSTVNGGVRGSMATSVNTPLPPPPPPPLCNFNSQNSNASAELEKSAYEKAADQRQLSHASSRLNKTTKTVVVEVHRSTTASMPEAAECQRHQNGMLNRSASYSIPQHQHEHNTLKASPSVASTTSSLPMMPSKAPAFNNHHHHHHHRNHDGAMVGGSSLSSAITEELKKRKEKQQQQYKSDDNTASNCSNRVKQHISQHETHQQQQQLQQQQQQRTSLRQQFAKRTACNGGITNCNERNNNRSEANDQHSALMDEFKRAHQRMFRNGFHESEERQERQDALKQTTIMEDDVNHRASRKINGTDLKNINTLTANKTTTANNSLSNNHHHQSHQSIPPPPPQFANSSTSTSKAPHQYSTSTAQIATNNLKVATKEPSAALRSAPISPTPDYDVSLRSTIPRSQQSQQQQTTMSTMSTVFNHYNNNNNNSSTNAVTNGDRAVDTSNVNHNRRTMRLGTVTIGEYEHQQQRKEPTKFDFIAQQQKRNGDSIDDNAQSLRTELQNTLSKANLRHSINSSSNHNNSNINNKQFEHMEHQQNCPLQQNVEQLTRKLQSFSTAAAAAAAATTTLSNRTSPKGGTIKTMTSNAAMTTTTTTPLMTTTSTVTLRNGGILKNGSRNSNSSSGSSGFSKNSEKTITFGN